MAFMTLCIIGLVILLVLVVIILVLWYFSMYNMLIRLKNNIDKAWSNIDVLLKQRHDELIKLMDTVKGYMQYEKGVLEAVTRARTAFMSAQTVAQKADADNLMTSALKSVFAVAENYPQLKASENFQQLQARISDLENQIADRREYYNDSVNTFNIKIEQIPSVWVARRMALTRRELFKAAAQDREDVKIKF